MTMLNRLWLKPALGHVDRIMWHLGWEPRFLNIAVLVLAAAGWVFLRSPYGLFLGTVVLIFRWKTAMLINRAYSERISEAESRVKQEGAARLGVRLADSEVYVVASGHGNSPLGVKARPEYDITVVYIADVFFAIYAGASLRMAKLEVELPAKGEEIYFRHVSAINYQDPVIEVVLANGRTARQFRVGSVGEVHVLDALRSKLRSASQPAHRSVASAPSETAIPQPSFSAPAAPPVAEPPEVALDKPTGKEDEERHCYLRSSKLMQLYQNPGVLEALIDQLEVPGKASVLKRLTDREKQEAIETQIDHFRRTPTSVWHGVPTHEVLAASIWRAQGEFLPRRTVREIFARVSQEEDLLRPISRWLRSRGFEPYMEVPLGRRRVDVLGYRASGIGRSASLMAVELKNEDAQFARGIDQMGTFAEYAHTVYLACTPAFCAAYLDSNAESRGVNHWDPGVLERKLSAGGLGLLIVEGDAVFEVLKPTERTPSGSNISIVVNALSLIPRVEY
jgi:hypothetical protein